MIESISIKNYKTIESLNLKLGRVTVFIGENGAGKSNILEAITLAGAACSNKLDNEFLLTRGMRVSESKMMRAAFSMTPEKELTPIEITVTSNDTSKAYFKLVNDNQPYSKWESETSYSEHGNSAPDLNDIIYDLIFTNKPTSPEKRKDVSKSLRTIFEILEKSKEFEDDLERKSAFILEQVKEHVKPGTAFFDHVFENRARMNEIGVPLSNFITFSPENTQLRKEETSGSIEPLGIKGDGLLKLIHVLSSFDGVLDEIKENLRLLDWFSDFTIRAETSGYALEIKDIYLDNPECKLDQNATNEGFMFLLFYFTLFASPIGPTFFAIDNIDTSLNPKLCQKLITQLTKMAKSNNKQVILTTHNPAILDGLNLDDDEQRLYTVSRTRSGHTKIKNIEKPISIDGAPELRLSEMFLRGLIGGLPKGF